MLCSSDEFFGEGNSDGTLYALLSVIQKHIPSLCLTGQLSPRTELSASVPCHQNKHLDCKLKMRLHGEALVFHHRHSMFFSFWSWKNIFYINLSMFKGIVSLE